MFLIYFITTVLNHRGGMTPLTVGLNRVCVCLGVHTRFVCVQLIMSECSYAGCEENDSAADYWVAAQGRLFIE